MNYYDARKRHDDGKYDYTRMNDGRIWPVGYCAQRTACSCVGPQNGFTGAEGCEKCGGSGRVDNADYCGSHDTPEEARECFARYLLDGSREITYGNWMGCEFEGCDTPTKKGMETRPPLGQAFALCDEHRDLEHLKQLAPSDAGLITASY